MDRRGLDPARSPGVVGDEAPALLASRREAEESVSRGPKLEVDVASRMGSASSSLPELSLGESTKTDARLPGSDPSRDSLP